MANMIVLALMAKGQETIQNNLYFLFVMNVVQLGFVVDTIVPLCN